MCVKNYEKVQSLINFMNNQTSKCLIQMIFQPKKENKLDHYHSPTIAIDLAHIQRIFHGNAQENDNWKIILGLNETFLS